MDPLPIDDNIATALNWPPERKGCALAARTLVHCVKATRNCFPEKLSADFLDALADHSARLKNWGEDDQTLLTMDSTVQKRPVFGQMLHSARASLPSKKLEIVDAAMGLILAYHISISRSLPVATVRAWRRIQACGSPRSGQHADWEKLANDFPTNKDSIQAWLESATEKDMLVFLASLALAWDTEIIIPSAPQSKDAIDTPTDGPKNTNTAVQETSTADDAEDDGCDPVEPTESYVGWLIQRANNAGYLGHLGLANRWEKQTTDELKFVCKVIAEAFHGDREEQTFALFASISFATSLPPNLTVYVGLTPNTDLWLNTGAGCVHWCLLRYLDLERAKSIGVSEIDRELMMEIWLPAAAHHLTEIFARLYPDATNVIELITGKGDEAHIKQFLKRYRAWLRSIGPTSLHEVCGARFARSGVQIYRQLFNDIAAALLALDFEESAMGMLHYVRISRAILHGMTTRVLQDIGLGPATTPSDLGGYIGPKGAMEVADFCEGLNQLFGKRQIAMKNVIYATSAQQAVNKFDEVVHCDQLLELSLTFGRDNHLDRQTWGNVMAYKGLVGIQDKDIEEFTDSRVIPAHKALNSLLNHHVLSKQFFASKLEEFGVIPSSPRGQRFDAPSSQRSFFETGKVVTVDGREYLYPQAVDTTRLAELSSAHLNGFLNVGRHTLISYAACTNIDSWLFKTITGHYRGHVEPFSDGMGTSPLRAIETITGILNKLFAPLAFTFGEARGNYVLGIQDFDGRMPSLTLASLRRENSRARVLDAPFDGFTFISLRVTDHLSELLSTGQGPTHTGANLLLNLLVENHILKGDLKTLWESAEPFLEITKRSVAAVWCRENCRAENRVLLVASSVIALRNLNNKPLRTTWVGTCEQARTWLYGVLPNLAWPANGDEAIGCLSAMLERRLRFHRPPFLLAAASPKLATPTASRSSIVRLASRPPPADPKEVLAFPKPKPRGKGNLRLSTTPLTEVIKKIHEWGDEAKHAGEDWALYKGLLEEVLIIDCTHDLSAAAFVTWVTMEQQRWGGSLGKRLQVSSLSTYIRLLGPAIVELKPVHDLRNNPELWFEFFNYLKHPRGVKPDENTAETVGKRLTAAKRFIEKLEENGWEIPSDLFDDFESNKLIGMRHAAASVLVLDADKSRITNLMKRQFENFPLDALLAELYPKIRLELSQRSIETAVLPISGLDEFGNLIITTDGFSHLKAENSRRPQATTGELQSDYTSIGKSIMAADREAKWMFLISDRSDWRFVVELERTFSAALKQVCQDNHAVPHSSRAVAPLKKILPGWEEIFRDMLNGRLTVARIDEFFSNVEALGFCNVPQALIETGHGHSITYLQYYFAVWDLLLSLYCHLDALHKGNTSALVAKMRPQYAEAFSKERRRKADAFNPESYVIAKELAALKLPRLTYEFSKHEQKQADSHIVKDVPKVDKARYLAARFSKQGSIAAAYNYDIDSTTCQELESLIDGVDTSDLQKRHQSKPSKRGMEAEIRYLKSADGEKLTKMLLATEKQTLIRFGNALSTHRTFGSLAPSIPTVQETLSSFLQCLPDGLGILIQFHPNRFSSDELLTIESCSPRAFVGPSDPDIGARPRITVVDASDSENLVRRARVNSVVRCLIAAIQIL